MLAETPETLAAVQYRVEMSICKFQSSLGMVVDGIEPLKTRKLPVGRERRKGEMGNEEPREKD